MSDYTDLQKAAEYAAQDTTKFADEDEEMRALQQFHEEVNPETVLALIAENEALRLALESCADELEGQVVQCYHGQPVEDMHPVTRRAYDRDMLCVTEARAAMGKGEQS